MYGRIGVVNAFRWVDGILSSPPEDSLDWTDPKGRGVIRVSDKPLLTDPEGNRKVSFEGPQENPMKAASDWIEPELLLVLEAEWSADIPGDEWSADDWKSAENAKGCD